MLPGKLPAGSSETIWLYLGLPRATPGRQRASTSDAPAGGKWLENDKVRLLLGPEGGHFYRWELKAPAGRDLTMPGEKDWYGFSDIGGQHRNATNKLLCTARGPALVRYTCTDDTGQVKTISLYAGASWAEVTVDPPTSLYWDIDDPANFTPAGPNAGTYLFSNGATGPTPPEGKQVMQSRVTWAIKWRADGLALGLATPEVPAAYRVGPGGSMGGVGIEQSPEAGHFLTFAGKLEGVIPREQMERLAQTLSFRRPPAVTVYGVQKREK